MMPGCVQPVCSKASPISGCFDRLWISDSHAERYLRATGRYFRGSLWTLPLYRAGWKALRLGKAKEKLRRLDLR